MKKFNPEGMYKPAGQYFGAVEVNSNDRLIYSSGIIGAWEDGSIVPGPQDQIDQAWRNVLAFINGCGLTTDNLVRMQMHITKHEFIEIRKRARIKHLGDHMNCAVTGLVVELFDPDLYIEIDVIAATN